MNGNNKKLMESILAHLRKLILLTEPGDEDKLKTLVNMACEVSNQLIRVENGEYTHMGTNESELDNDDTDDDQDEDSDTEDIEY